MVLQRDKPVPVWGQASPGTLVKVQFAGQQAQTKAGTDGKWMVSLKPLKLSANPQNLTISGEGVITLKNILVGDVWLCSGQSNMEYPIDRSRKRYAPPGKGADVAGEEMKSKTRPAGVRYLYVEKNLKTYPILPTRGWFTDADTSFRDITALGYFFAKKVQLATGVPIGIISSSWGGTRIEPWTPPADYAMSEIFKKEMTSDTFKIDGMKPGQMYRSLIEPLVPFAIKGVLWYQGESNAMIEDQATYAEKFRVFEQSWRQKFKDKSLPFYTVQIAPFLYTSRKDPKPHTPYLLPQFWEAQTNCLKFPGTYMVVTTDLVDNLKDIHPSYKWIIGERMATQALYHSYGQKETTGNHPNIKDIKKQGVSLVLSFENTGGKLQSMDGKPLTWFELAGTDSVFYPAEAIIETDKIKVSAKEVTKPVYVRFAWHETAMPNLSGGTGLPVIPFMGKVK